jgi:molecular chaperone DnaJ
MNQEGSQKGEKEIPDYYEVLGVSPTASYDTVKKAYAEVARTHHPDRGNHEADTDLFSLATEAKNTLLDPIRRQAYDRKLASQHIETRPKYENGEIPLKRKADPYHVDIDLDLRDVMNGAVKTIEISPKRVCAECGGMGSTKGTFTPCTQCNGHGLLCTTFTGSPEEGTGEIEATGDCFRCAGLGVRRERKGSTCKRCNGVGVEKITTELRIEVPPGIVAQPNGYTMIEPNQGHCRVNGLPGDVVVHARVPESTISVPAESFTFGKTPYAEPTTVKMERRKNGQHILIRQTLTLDQALLGFSIRFKHLNGTDLVLTPIKKDVITQNRHGRVLAGGGFPPPPGTRGVSGTLIVQYHVVLPETMSAAGKEHFAQFLRIDEPKLLEQEASRKREVEDLSSFSGAGEGGRELLPKKKKQRVDKMWWWGGECRLS